MIQQGARHDDKVIHDKISTLLRRLQAAKSFSANGEASDPNIPTIFKREIDVNEKQAVNILVENKMPFEENKAIEMSAPAPEDL